MDTDRPANQYKRFLKAFPKVDFVESARVGSYKVVNYYSETDGDTAIIEDEEGQQHVVVLPLAVIAVSIN